MSKGKYVSKEEHDRMIELDKQGLKPGEIAERMSRDYNTVYKHLRSARLNGSEVVETTQSPEVVGG